MPSPTAVPTEPVVVAQLGRIRSCVSSTAAGIASLVEMIEGMGGILGYELGTVRLALPGRFEVVCENSRERCQSGKRTHLIFLPATMRPKIAITLPMMPPIPVMSSTICVWMQKCWKRELTFRTAWSEEYLSNGSWRL